MMQIVMKVLAVLLFLASSMLSSADELNAAPANEWARKLARLASRGTLIRAFDFSTADQLGTKNGVLGFLPSADGSSPSLDSLMAAHHGGGSLRFVTKPFTGSTASGEWWANFSPDLSKRFAENTEFWVEWMERVDQNWMNAVLTTTDGRQIGIKSLILGHEDGPKASRTGTNVAASSEDMKVVVAGFGSTKPEYRFPVAYRYYPRPGYTSGFDETAFAPRPWSFQPGGPWGETCNYPGPYGNGRCFNRVPDLWMKFSLRVKLGAAGIYNDSRANGDGNYLNIPVFLDSEVQLYCQLPGQERVTIIDWRPGLVGYRPLYRNADWQYGKLWFGNYMTNKNPKQSHVTMTMWITDVIVATEDPSYGDSTRPALK